MKHPSQHISDLAELLYLHGVRDVIISPGSRNAPLIRAFYHRFGDNCTSIVDERSAAYFALGKSLGTKNICVLISTSGTAALNYAPALAEAFFQGIPLLVLTADRPIEWIGQQNNQAIWQNNIFSENVKAEYTFPLESSISDDLWYAHRITNEAIHRCLSDKPGPVHINIPFREPLYEELPKASANLKIVHLEKSEFTLNKTGFLAQKWKEAKSIMLVAGQQVFDNELFQILKEIQKDNRVVLIAEPTSNLHALANVSSPEVVLNNKFKYPSIAIPELVIYFGGQLISQKIKLFLQKIKSSTFIAILPNHQIIDTFQNVNSIIINNPLSVFCDLPVNDKSLKSLFKSFWEGEVLKAEAAVEKYSVDIDFSDLLTYKTISENLPKNAIIFAGNSNAIRYLFYFGQKERIFYSNRGTSGIDGCLSTAAGLASKLNKTVYAIVGDLSFVYDSNALWNKNLPENLKIILVNNQGGGIFHLLKGPSENNAFIPFFNAHHAVNFQKLSEAFGIPYQHCSSVKKLKDSIKKMILEKGKTEILEIQTPNNGEPQLTKDFFKFLNINYETKLDMH